MLTGALATYAAAILVIVASVAIGGGILAACGRREWSWAAPAAGLAAATVIAWWAVRLPGEGVTALACVALAGVVGAVFAVRRLGALGEALRAGLWPCVLALVLASVPFAVEGHFGVLGTGFNVDMSQHLLAADWLGEPSGAAPGLYEQGYPLGPHALAVASSQLTGELALAFTGVTIAIPALLALTALGACSGLSRRRSIAVALLTAFAYLVATYLAQGSFKELFAATFLVATAVWLGELGRGGAGEGIGRRAGVVPAVLAAGALYAYSGPGLAWLAGTMGIWAGLELIRHRKSAAALLRGGAPAAAIGLATLVVLAAPELDRIADFGGSVGTVSERAQAPEPSVLLAVEEEISPLGREAVQISLPGSSSERSRTKGPEFDDDLGNLFGQISPLEAFGVWPSGDFRVAPGDGSVPAIVFYLSAVLGLAGLAVGIAWAYRSRETALLAALAAAVAVWAAARIGSTPYTAAKALEMVAPVAMLLAARGLLDPGWLGQISSRTSALRAALTAAFVAGAALSSGLALANAPVGPEDYRPGVRDLSERFAGAPTLVLAPAEEIADQHGTEWYAWEAREASPVCVLSEGRAQLPEIEWVVEVDGDGSPPFAGLAEEASAGDVTLWRVPAPERDGRLDALGEGQCAGVGPVGSG